MIYSLLILMTEVTLPTQGETPIFKLIKCKNLHPNHFTSEKTYFRLPTCPPHQVPRKRPTTSHVQDLVQRPNWENFILPHCHLRVSSTSSTIVALPSWDRRPSESSTTQSLKYPGTRDCCPTPTLPSPTTTQPCLSWLGNRKWERGNAQASRRTCHTTHPSNFTLCPLVYLKSYPHQLRRWSLVAWFLCG